MLAWPNVLEFALRGSPAGVRGIIWCLIGVQSLSSCLAAIYGGRRLFGLRALFVAGSAIPLVVPSLVLFALGVSTVERYLLWYAGTSAAMTLGWFLTMAVRARIKLRLDGRMLGAMGRYASWAYLSTVLDILTARLDVFLLNHFASAGAVGVYSVAVGLAGRLGVLPNVVGHIVFNRASATEIGAGHTTARLVRLNATLTTVVGIAAALAGTVLVVPLYGSEFGAAVLPFYVMIPSTIFWGLYRLLASDLEGRGLPGLVSVCSGAATICIVVLDVLWIPQHGVMGAAWASFIAYGMALVTVAYAFCRSTGLGLGTAFAPRRSDVSILYDTLAKVGANLRPRPIRVASP
jgi:O-antigen/teichoic acid export membrane protein